MARVLTGLEVLCTERLELCKGRRVGLLCHPASVAFGQIGRASCRERV